MGYLLENSLRTSSVFLPPLLGWNAIKIWGSRILKQLDDLEQAWSPQLQSLVIQSLIVIIGT